MGHLFVSYSRKDLGFAERLVARLEQNEQTVWIDRENITGGKFKPQIVEAIEGASTVILIFSEHSSDSDFVRREIDLAHDAGKNIEIVDLRPELALPTELKVQLAGLQRIDFSRDFDLGANTLLQCLTGAPRIQAKKDSNICPYKGLEFFDCNDEDPKYFFGREALVSRLIEHVRRSNFLALVGASGNGKSSVLRAGLLHQIKQGQLIKGSDRWRIRVTRPEREPMANLAMAFVEEGLREVDRATELGKVQGLLSEGAAGLKRLIQVAPEPRVVLVIDQFEEVFTRCGNGEERERYLATLMGVLERVQEKLCLIIAMRSDFIVKCHEKKYSGLAQRIDNNQVSVTPMEPNELKSAITEPAEKLGLFGSREAMMPRPSHLDLDVR